MATATDEMNEKVELVLEKYGRDKGMLVAILQDVQSAVKYLPEEALIQISRGLGIPLSQVYSVATFFKALSLEPRGRHLINVCLGTACHVRGAEKVLDKIERDLEISTGETTADLKFTLETVNCVGACALGPIVIIDEEYHGEMTTDKVEAMLKSYS
jgi:NADH-quinone oxidoreductase subunit E